MPLSQVYGVQAGLVGGSREQPAKPLRASQPKPPAEEARGAEPSSPPASSRDRVAKRPRASQQKPPSEEARAAETRSPPASSSDGAAKRPRDSQHKPPSDEAPKPPAGNRRKRDTPAWQLDYEVELSTAAPLRVYLRTSDVSDTTECPVLVQCLCPVLVQCWERDA